MTEEDIALSKEEISAKYPQGSPDHPSHYKSCVCSGCFASWLEWRAAHLAFELGVKIGGARAIRWVVELQRENPRVGEFALNELAGLIEHGATQVPK